MIGLKVSGATTAFLDLQIAGRRLDETLRATVRDVAREYEARLKVELARPKSGKRYGRTYRRVRRKTVVFGKTAAYWTVQRSKRDTRPYTASRPGEAPASRSGNLVRAVRIKFPSRQKGYGAKVFASRNIAFYRHFLEFGTGPRVQKRWRGKTVNRSVGQVAPRPVFSPLQAQLDAELERRLTRAAELFAAFSG